MGRMGRRLAGVSGAMLYLAACGGAGTTAPPPPPPPPAAPAPSFVHLESDAADFVGGGAVYHYTLADAELAATAIAGHLNVEVKGDERWTGEFELPSGSALLRRGEFKNLKRYPFHETDVGGMSWGGDGRGCNTLLGSFTIDSVVYTGGALSLVDLHFEQHCEGASPALRGTVHWWSGDQTKPAGPVTPIPTSLWAPAAGKTPATGNYVYLESNPGEYVGAGQSYTYTQANSVIVMAADGGHLSVTVTGDEAWFADFVTMNRLTRLEPGYYPSLRRFGGHNPTRGGLHWSGEGRACGSSIGWLAVDQVTYANGTVTAIDLRFEQRCDATGPPLHGVIHWRSDDLTRPSGPIRPVPADLWRPAPGATPTAGTFVYLESQPGDFIGGGQTYLHTPADIAIQAIADRGHLSITVGDARGWRGEFQTMNVLDEFEPGYYPDLRRLGASNPTKGGLSWSGRGRGCNTLRGWFVVEQAVYVGSTITALDLRFEQHCEGFGPALRGLIHWHP
jgi:hypothetical protein